QESLHGLSPLLLPIGNLETRFRQDLHRRTGECNKAPPLLERDQVGPTQGRCFLLKGLVRRVRAVLIQYLVKTDDFLIVVGPQARIHRDHDRVIAQCCSDRRVEYGPADLPSGENERRNAFSLESFVQVGIEKPVLRIGNKGYVARGGCDFRQPFRNVWRSRPVSHSDAGFSRACKSALIAGTMVFKHLGWDVQIGSTTSNTSIAVLAAFTVTATGAGIGGICNVIIGLVPPVPDGGDSALCAVADSLQIANAREVTGRG